VADDIDAHDEPDRVGPPGHPRCGGIGQAEPAAHDLRRERQGNLGDQVTVATPFDLADQLVEELPNGGPEPVGVLPAQCGSDQAAQPPMFLAMQHHEAFRHRLLRKAFRHAMLAHPEIRWGAEPLATEQSEALVVVQHGDAERRPRDPIRFAQLEHRGVGVGRDFRVEVVERG
jgi:hypothetical protein